MTQRHDPTFVFSQRRRAISLSFSAGWVQAPNQPKLPKLARCTCTLGWGFVMRYFNAVYMRSYTLRFRLVCHLKALYNTTTSAALLKLPIPCDQQSAARVLTPCRQRKSARPAAAPTQSSSSGTQQQLPQHYGATPCHQHERSCAAQTQAGTPARNAATPASEMALPRSMKRLSRAVRRASAGARCNKPPSPIPL